MKMMKMKMKGEEFLKEVVNLSVAIELSSLESSGSRRCVHPELLLPCSRVELDEKISTTHGKYETTCRLGPDRHRARPSRGNAVCPS
ncbi:hypothetical protein EYF80_058901 [Liparis tanakae]|uniref:Uncharacterized protein n=1 Tax=Liparis tanakae TaxID=230148 RepID=A0A4Z2EQ45_9TELE|nr:hypothetical protein EYF80_058901 [Liparis tanakae]